MKKTTLLFCILLCASFQGVKAYAGSNTIPIPVETPKDSNNQTRTFVENKKLKTCKIQKKYNLEDEKTKKQYEQATEEIKLRMVVETEYYDCTEKDYDIIKEITEGCAQKNINKKSCDVYTVYAAHFKNENWFEASMRLESDGKYIAFKPQKLPTCDKNGEPVDLCCAEGATYKPQYAACLPDNNIEKPPLTDEDPLVHLRSCNMPICNNAFFSDLIYIGSDGKWHMKVDGKAQGGFNSYKDVGLKRKNK